MKIINASISKQLLFQTNTLSKDEEELLKKAVQKIFGAAILKKMFLDMWQLSIQEMLSDDEIYEKLAELNTELAQKEVVSTAVQVFQKGLADAFSKSE